MSIEPDPGKLLLANAQRKSRLLLELQQYRAGEAYSFHMPGHKGGRGAPPEILDALGTSTFAADVSEVGGFDYLHAPKGNVLLAQSETARAFGADSTYFLINGATAGNIAALLASVGDGDKLLMARNSHRSVYAGVALTGAEPIYLWPSYDPSIGYLGAFTAPPERPLGGAKIQAIHITCPSYYGVCIEVGKYAELARASSVPLIVDEAHGSHFGFHPELPPSALSHGADIVVQSPHKTLGSLTQSALLHIKGSKVPRGAIEQALQMVQSSSPSAILLMSLDAACARMARDGHELMTRALWLAETARKETSSKSKLTCYAEELLRVPNVEYYDPTKLIIDVRSIGLTGFEAARWLNGHKRIGIELADTVHIVCSITVGDDEDSIAYLVAGLRDLCHAHEPASQPSGNPLGPLPSPPEVAVSPRRAMRAKATEVAVRESRSRVCAEYVIPYPPGIPLVVPGEVISDDLLAYIYELRSNGCRITGPADPTFSTIRVLC